MAAFALDTSCMVAAVCPWHERHANAVKSIEDLLDRRGRLRVAAHALVEAYSVLTRLPAPHRMAPTDACALIHANFVKNATVVTLPAGAYVLLLGRLASEGIAGGRTYDALIAECAARSKVKILLTFNPRHFDPPPAGVVVVEPR